MAIRAAGSEDGLPEGEGKQILETFCTNCHEFNEISKFGGYYDRRQWRDVIVTMIEYGAPLDARQIDQLADYLAQHFGKQ